MILLLILLVALFVIGAPIFSALALPSLINILSSDLDIAVFFQRMYGGLDRFTLLSIPFFIFAANIMGRGGMSRRIVRVADVFLGRFYGGTATANIAACEIFGALSGSSPATVVAIGGITYPMLQKSGYDDKFSVGLITAASSIAIVIPPSITMIVYACSAGASVGSLFIAGIVPGVLMGVFFAIYSYFYSRKHNIRASERYSGKEKWRAVKESLLALGVPVIILGGIYSGIFTPTESATAAAFYALVISLFVYREMNLQQLYKCCLDSVITTGQVMILVAAASVLSWVLTVNNVQTIFSNMMTPFIDTPAVVLLIMSAIVFVAGMFMDAVPFTLLLAPLFVPLCKQMGVDLIQLGMIITVGGALGMYTPPFGLNIFVSMGAFKKSFTDVTKGVIPFIVLGAIMLLLVALVPQLSVWLPNMAG